MTGVSRLMAVDQTAEARIALVESALHYARRGWSVVPLHTPVVS